jgi:hypothetical protein
MSGDAWIADALVRGKFATAIRLAQNRRWQAPTLRILLHSFYRDCFPPGFQDLVDRGRGRARNPGFAPTVEPRQGWVSLDEYGRVPVWRRGRVVDADWRITRQVLGPEMAWRARQAFVPQGIDWRSPFNDLRVVELMAGTPSWMKRFKGRRKDILREAESRDLPRLIPDRLDNGIYNELTGIGVGGPERDRALQGLEAVVSVPGVRSDKAREEVFDWIESNHDSWVTSWCLITAGLWLRGRRGPPGCTRTRLMTTISNMEIAT